MNLFKNLLVLFLLIISIDNSILFVVRKTDLRTDLSELENYIQEAKQFVNPRYRQKYHISAPVGWINDPNGFSYYNNEYHMFYQFHPYSAEWGPMHWGHVKSKNLVDWEYVSTALIPGDEYDINGCFSGSAIENNGKLILIYTGNIDDPIKGNIQYQNLATSEDGITFRKYEGNPVIADAPNGVKDFRDPKVWRYKEYFYVVLGNATPDGRGRVVLYRSSDLTDWNYVGVLAESDGSLGYMWECPDFFELEGKFVLIISPQGMTQSGDRYKNLHQTGYLVGSFDYETNIFNVESESFVELDYGHDFYAPQSTETPDGRRVVVGWLDMWESEFKEKEDKWAGTLTIPRELSLAPNGKILMKPVKELISLRDYLVFSGFWQPGIVVGYTNNNLEVIATVGLNYSDVIGIDFLISETETVHLYYDSEVESVILDRGGGDAGIRKVPWKSSGPITWNIFIDSSSIEVFCGNGEVVFSSRIYPSQPVVMRPYGAIMSVDIFSLRQSVEL